jgi:MFS family permease
MSEPGGKTVGSPGPDHRWLVLVTVAIAQLMVVLDATIVNIALPSAQRDLGFANSDRQWVVTAYALAFGGLLLLGGRVGDLFSRKRVFIVGLLGFAGAFTVAALVFAVAAVLAFGLLPSRQRRQAGGRLEGGGVTAGPATAADAAAGDTGHQSVRPQPTRGQGSGYSQTER